MANERVSAVPAPVDPTAEIDAVLRKLTDRIFLLALTLGVVAFCADTSRLALTGFKVCYLVDAITFGLMLGVLSVRRRVPVTVVLWVLVGSVFVQGLVSLAILGLASAAMMMLTATCIVVGIFAGLRPAAITAIAMAIAIVISGVVHVSSARMPAAEVASFVNSPATWATQTSIFLVYVLGVVSVSDSVMKRLTRSLRELGEREGELVRTAERLQKSEREHRLLAENISDVVFVLGLDLTLRYLSQSAEALFGRPLDELLERGVAGVMTPTSLQRGRETYFEYLALAKQGPVEVPLLEYEYVRADGSTFWGELRTTFLRDAEGHLVGSQGVLRDITERRRAEQVRLALEERLNQAEKLRAVGQLAGGIAHDFNNQLAAIMGFAGLIEREASSNPTVRGHAASILVAADRSADLVGKLLTFARRGQHRSLPFDVHEIISEVVSMLERSVDKRVRIEIRLGAQLAVILGDPTQFSNALLNLGLNACDAMPGGGSLCFATSTTDAGSWLEVAVSDTGTGMDSETRSRAFEPFFTTKGPGEGTGLGLAAVYGTVQTHHGTIDVESCLGAGTTFRIRVPMHEGAPAELPSSTRRVAPATTRRATILVVDDEPLVGRVAGLALEAVGHDVQVFESPQAALEHYRDHPHATDVVLLDMVMPDMNGEEVFAALRSRDPDAAVVLTSGHAPSAAVKELLPPGARGFIAKPFTSTELVETIARALEGPASTRRQRRPTHAVGGEGMGGTHGQTPDAGQTPDEGQTLMRAKP